MYIFIYVYKFGFMKGRGTTDAIFIARQLQEKYIAKKKSCTLPLLTWRKPLIGFLVMLCGGQCAN